MEWYGWVVGDPTPKKSPKDLSTEDPRAFLDFLCRVKSVYPDLGYEDREPLVTLDEMADPTLPEAPAWEISDPGIARFWRAVMDERNFYTYSDPLD